MAASAEALAASAGAEAEEDSAGLAAAAAAAVAPLEDGNHDDAFRNAFRSRDSFLRWASRCRAAPTTGSRGRKRQVKTALAEVQNQLQRRNDLIPNLVETVKGYASQERDIFTAIAESRSRMMNAKTPDEQVEAANAQTSALARLLAVVENYPQLKSDANFQRLMDELAGTENRIAVAGSATTMPRDSTTPCDAASLQRHREDLRLPGIQVLRSAARRAESSQGRLQAVSDRLPGVVD